MVTLQVIPEDAREAMEDGKHVMLTSPEGRKIVLAFEEHSADVHHVCNWEEEDAWRVPDDEA